MTEKKRFEEEQRGLEEYKMKTEALYYATRHPIDRNEIVSLSKEIYKFLKGDE